MLFVAMAVQDLVARSSWRLGAGRRLCRYRKYADLQRWKVQLLTTNSSEAGGYRECVLQVAHLPFLLSP